MNDLNFSELQNLSEQLKTLKAELETDPAPLSRGICDRVEFLRGYHMQDWPKHSGDYIFPIKVKDWEIGAAAQYSSVFYHQASSEVAAQYIELRKELLDFLINKAEKEISERQQKGKSNEQ